MFGICFLILPRNVCIAVFWKKNRKTLPFCRETKLSFVKMQVKTDDFNKFYISDLLWWTPPFWPRLAPQKTSQMIRGTSFQHQRVVKTMHINNHKFEVYSKVVTEEIAKGENNGYVVMKSITKNKLRNARPFLHQAFVRYL